MLMYYENKVKVKMYTLLDCLQNIGVYTSPNEYIGS